MISSDLEHSHPHTRTPVVGSGHIPLATPDAFWKARHFYDGGCSLHWRLNKLERYIIHKICIFITETYVITSTQRVFYTYITAGKQFKPARSVLWVAKIWMVRRFSPISNLLLLTCKDMNGKKVFANSKPPFIKITAPNISCICLGCFWTCTNICSKQALIYIYIHILTEYIQILTEKLSITRVAAW